MCHNPNLQIDLSLDILEHYCNLNDLTILRLSNTSLSLTKTLTYEMYCYSQTGNVRKKKLIRGIISATDQFSDRFFDSLHTGDLKSDVKGLRTAVKFMHPSSVKQLIQSKRHHKRWFSGSESYAVCRTTSMMYNSPHPLKQPAMY